MKTICILEDDVNFIDKEKTWIKEILGPCQFIYTPNNADLYQRSARRPRCDCFNRTGMNDAFSCGRTIRLLMGQFSAPKYIFSVHIILEHCQKEMTLSIEQGQAYIRVRIRMHKKVSITGDDFVIYKDHAYYIYTLILGR